MAPHINKHGNTAIIVGAIPAVTSHGHPNQRPTALTARPTATNAGHLISLRQTWKVELYDAGALSDGMGFTSFSTEASQKLWRVPEC